MGWSYHKKKKLDALIGNSSALVIVLFTGNCYVMRLLLFDSSVCALEFIMKTATSVNFRVTSTLVGH